ncbi:MAG: DMT family transporter [Bacteroidetes bacterium]|nr:DMT family transporter [Bacteroidota bacterium]
MAYIYAILAVTCWSTIGSAFKLTLRYAGYIEILLYSSLIASIILFIILIFQEKAHLLWKSSATDIGRSALFGFLNPFLYYMILVKAYELLQAQEAVALNYTWPIALVLLSIPVLKQKIGLRSIVALFVSFAGIVIIITRGNFTSLNLSNGTGIALALGSSIVWAAYWILNMKDQRDEIPKLLLNFFFGFIYTLFAAIFTGNLRILPWEGYAGVVYIGFFEMGITFALWLIALKLSETTARVSNLIFLSPFLSLLIISIAVGEKILLSTFLGLIFIVGGIILQRFSGTKSKMPKSA